MPDRKFTTLRKRLDQLGYRQPLVIEAIPLVEKLFSDLVHTTESFKNYKVKVKKPESSGTSDLSEPYRNDNARLVTENNELHQKLIKSKEENEKLIVETKSCVHKLENENQDLKFLNSQYITKMKMLEKESKQKSDHIMKLEEHNMNAVVETPGGRKKNIPFRRQRMDIESTLSQSDNMLAQESQQRLTSDPYIADLLGIADNRIEDLKQELLVLKSENEKLHKTKKILSKQVESRENEITRLSKQLEGGRPIEAIVTDVKNTSSNRVVAHLNIQVDYLQQANRDLEKKISKLNETESERMINMKSLQDRNDELCMELAAMDKMFKNFDIENEKFKADVNGQVDMLKSEIRDKEKTIADLEANSYNSKQERDDLIEESEQLNTAMRNAISNKENILQLYERSEKEKRRLAEKNAKLTISERELAMQLERVKISKGFLPKKTPDLRSLVKNLEDDRDHYKNELDELQKLLYKRFITNDTSHDISMKDKTNAVTHLLREEVDFYKKENEILRNSRKLISPTTHDNDGIERSELAKVKRERDELQKMLESFEKHLLQIQENVKLVTVERDNVQLLYEQTNEEVQRLRRINVKSRSPSKKVTEILEKAEKERDEALSELRRARNDIQKMKVEIRNIEKLYKNEKYEQEDKQRDVESLLGKIEDENNNLNDRVSSTQNMIETLEEQLSVAHNAMRNLQEALGDKNAELSRLKLLLEQSEESSNDLRKKYEGKTLQFDNLENQHTDLKEEYDNIEKKLSEYKREIKRLKSVTASLDRERDDLQHEVDEKAEKLARLDDGIRQHQQADTELKLNIEELNEKLSYNDQELKSKNLEIGGLEKQLHCLEKELAGLTKTRDGTLRENKRLLDDLGLMTEENQTLHRQLQDTTNEGHTLKQQIEEYAMHVGRIEDLLSQKELEREELLLQYKTLSNKADMLETTKQQKEDESVSVMQNLVHTQQEISHLQERCAVLEAQVEQHISTEESYENQIHMMQQSIGNLENQLQSVTEEKNSILEDLYAVRELCVRLDQTRDELTKKIAVKTNQQEKLEEIINSTQAESEVMRKQILHEKDNIRSLENVISTTREKQFIEKKVHENGLMDLENIKSDLIKAEKERYQKETENKNLRKQTSLLQDEVQSLRKRLTNEKYERERLNQEIRTKTHSPSSVILTREESIPSNMTKPMVDFTVASNKDVSFSPMTFESSDDESSN